MDVCRLFLLPMSKTITSANQQCMRVESTVNNMNEFRCVENTMNRMIDHICQEHKVDEVLMTNQGTGDSKFDSPNRQQHLAQTDHHVQSYSTDELTLNIQEYDRLSQDAAHEKNLLNSADGELENIQEAHRNNEHIPSSCPAVINGTGECLLSDSEVFILSFLDDMQSLTTKDTISEDSHRSVFNFKRQNQQFPLAVVGLKPATTEKISATDSLSPQALLDSQEFEHRNLLVSRFAGELNTVITSPETEVSSLCHRTRENKNESTISKHASDPTKVPDVGLIACDREHFLHELTGEKTPMDSTDVAEESVGAIATLNKSMRRDLKRTDLESKRSEGRTNLQLYVSNQSNNHSCSYLHTYSNGQKQNIFDITEGNATEITLQKSQEYPDKMSEVAKDIPVDDQVKKLLNFTKDGLDKNGKKKECLERTDNYLYGNGAISSSEMVKCQDEINAHEAGFEPSPEASGHRMEKLIPRGDVESSAENIHKTTNLWSEPEPEQTSNFDLQANYCTSRSNFDAKAIDHIVTHTTHDHCGEPEETLHQDEIESEQRSHAISQSYDLGKDPEVLSVVIENNESCRDEHSPGNQEVKVAIRNIFNEMKTVKSMHDVPRYDNTEFGNKGVSWSLEQMQPDFWTDKEQNDPFVIADQQMKQNCDGNAKKYDPSAVCGDREACNNHAGENDKKQMLCEKSSTETGFNHDMTRPDDLFVKSHEAQLLSKPACNLTARIVPDIEVKVATDTATSCPVVLSTTVEKERCHDTASNHSERGSLSCTSITEPIQDQLVPDNDYLVHHVDLVKTLDGENRHVKSSADESLYSTEDIPKESCQPASNFKWKYRPSCDGEDEELATPVEEMEPFFGNIQPLITGLCSRSLRIGLSRKQKVKRLHKNVN